MSFCNSVLQRTIIFVRANISALITVGFREKYIKRLKYWYKFLDYISGFSYKCLCGWDSSPLGLPL